MRAIFDVKISKETLYCVQGADLLWIKSRPLVKAARRFTNNCISTQGSLQEHVIKNFALISQPYLIENKVCDPPKSILKARSCIRPENYGRACLVDINGRFVEVKGCGVPANQIPRNEPYKDGLYHIHNAVYELFCQILVQRILKPYSSLRTQESLALLKLPLRFRLGKKHAVAIPAAILVREAAFSFSLKDLRSDADFVRSDLNPFRIEMIFRKHGLTTCNPFERFKVFEENGSVRVKKGQMSDLIGEVHGLQEMISQSNIKLPCILDLLNIQFAYKSTNDTVLVKDFEHFNSQKIFKYPVVTTLRKGETAILNIEKESFIKNSAKMKNYNRLTQYCSIRHFDKNLKKYSDTMTTTPIHYYALLHHNDRNFSQRILELIDVANGKPISLRLSRFLDQFHSNICTNFPESNPNSTFDAHAEV